MKTMSCQPKVIIHRLGGPVTAPRRISPGAVITVLLLLAAFAAGTVRHRWQDGPHRLRQLSSLR